MWAAVAFLLLTAWSFCHWRLNPRMFLIKARVRSSSKMSATSCSWIFFSASYFFCSLCREALKELSVYDISFWWLSSFFCRSRLNFCSVASILALNYARALPILSCQSFSFLSIMDLTYSWLIPFSSAYFSTFFVSVFMAASIFLEAFLFSFVALLTAVLCSASDWTSFCFWCLPPLWALWWWDFLCFLWCFL